MRLSKFGIVAFTSIVVGLGVANAQVFNGPAETPPAGFKGAQYVDTRGCFFVRKASDGQLRWVPLVSASHEPICERGPAVSDLRVGPKSVPREIAEARTIQPPKGYKSAWTDGRLNPLAGVRTASGKAQMQLVWSDTVPRRLLDRSKGKPATRKQLRLFGY